MPFRSNSQRRKFYALKAEGKMDQKTIDEWEKDTPKKLPEKLGSRNVRKALNIFMDAQNQILQEDPEYKKIRKKLMKKEAFWNGFEKQAWWWSKKEEKKDDIKEIEPDPDEVFHVGLAHHVGSFNINVAKNGSNHRAELLHTDVSNPKNRYGLIGVFDGKKLVHAFHAMDNSSGQHIPAKKGSSHPAIAFKTYHPEELEDLRRVLNRG